MTYPVRCVPQVIPTKPTAGPSGRGTWSAAPTGLLTGVLTQEAEVSRTLRARLRVLSLPLRMDTLPYASFPPLARMHSLVISSSPVHRNDEWPLPGHLLRMEELSNKAEADVKWWCLLRFID